ncbi:type IV toxin-antitoxin system AbiEi family antitoxin domain-containing protein [Gulosibacter sediminis]|uniref:type IV toxin-antitoxin system AbiEi family antitoxin domain-containing protein n=1 Tax=Gulosibacter sediminis TaxID=1729695 RepID=UPI0024A8E36F|nr:type IV toxin-antitoxin system AbiEi family antitoxin domain-containing protein [Gulosibacter sediminis]
MRNSRLKRLHGREIHRPRHLWKPAHPQPDYLRGPPHLTRRLARGMNLTYLFEQNFGVVRTKQLLDTGLTRREVQSIAKSGQIEKVRRGWWVSKSYPANSDVLRAVKAGGVLTGPSALKARGLWCPAEITTLAVRGSDRRRKKESKAKDSHNWFFLDRKRAQHVPRSCDDADTALLVTMLHYTCTQATVLADSAVERKLLTADEVKSAAELAGHRGAAVMRHFDASAGSGTESLLRIWLKQHRIKYRTQVEIEDVGRVDFLIGNRLVIEVDSKTHHLTAEAYRSDRERDRKLVARGYLVMRLTYEEVTGNIDAIGDYILEIVGRDDHRRKPEEWTTAPRTIRRQELEAKRAAAKAAKPTNAAAR